MLYSENKYFLIRKVSRIFLYNNDNNNNNNNNNNFISLIHTEYGIRGAQRNISLKCMREIDN